MTNCKCDQLCDYLQPQTSRLQHNVTNYMNFRFKSIILWNFQLTSSCFLDQYVTTKHQQRGAPCVSPLSLFASASWVPLLMIDFGFPYVVASVQATFELIHDHFLSGFVTWDHFVPSLYPGEITIFMTWCPEALSRKTGSKFLLCVSMPAPQ